MNTQSVVIVSTYITLWVHSTLVLDSKSRLEGIVIDNDLVACFRMAQLLKRILLQQNDRLDL